MSQTTPLIDENVDDTIEMAAPGEAVHAAIQQQADEAFAAGDLGRAADLYRELLAAEPQLAHASCRLGEIAIKNQDYALAEQCYRDAIQRQPDYPWAHAGLGECLGRAKRWASASEHFRLACQALPDNPHVLELLDTAQRAATEQQVQANELLTRADERFAATDFASAEHLYREATEASGYSLPHPFCRLGEIAVNRGDAEAAEEYYRQATAVDDSYVWAYFGLGQALMSRERWGEASKAFARARELKPDADYIAELHRRALANEQMLPVWAAVRQGKADEARHALSSVLISNPDLDDAWAAVKQLLTIQGAANQDNLGQFRVEIELNNLFNQGLERLTAELANAGK